jgi:hypothetical protein
MTNVHIQSAGVRSATYAALRHGGSSPTKARLQLGVEEMEAARLEKLFLARAGRGPDAMRPSFARHRQHVAAVTAAGGFPVLKLPGCR